MSKRSLQIFCSVVKRSHKSRANRGAKGFGMGYLFQSDGFPGFGPNALDRSEQSPELVCVSGKRSTSLRQRVRKGCPRHAGVYGMLSDRDELIYVGKAKC